MKKLYSKKRNADAMKTPMFLKLVYCLSSSLLIAYIVLSYYAEDQNSLVYDILQYSCLSSAIVIMILVTVINYIRGGYIFKSYEEMVKKELDKYFDKLNRETYLTRGLEWYAVPNHYWAELRILPNYRVANDKKDSFKSKPPLFSPTSSVIDQKRMSLNDVRNAPLPEFYDDKKPNDIELAK